MNSPTHTIDPDGEVIIILRNANSPFAQLAGNTFTSRDSDVFPWLFGNAQSSHEATEATKILFEQPELSLKEKGRNKKKEKKRKAGAILTALESTSPPLMILLQAIHGQYYHIPRKLTLEMLAKVAVIADYYDCKEALYFQTDMWIMNVEENIPTAVSRDLTLWLWVAWFFQLSSQFKLSTSIAMSQSDGWIDNLGLPSQTLS
ncbi:uncharacterized protein N7511_008384 [Penicillium nucicola]|uniref:uncharacterized protein n=1 Tax=Penicillium nucicola TaxID=1850975 RepID=UPI0025456908|nr:uncharacterized protein N7511_008384 [Penicillium nucicola]KAJ5751419.1 hypothetical protein N7511_008384 [Penicillium nucicola]